MCVIVGPRISCECVRKNGKIFVRLPNGSIEANQLASIKCTEAISGCNNDFQIDLVVHKTLSKLVYTGVLVDMCGFVVDMHRFLELEKNEPN